MLGAENLVSFLLFESPASCTCSRRLGAPLTPCVRVRLLACSLHDNNLGDEAGQAIGKGLEHTPNLERLE